MSKFIKNNTLASIEGNIGSGKSTLLAEMQRRNKEIVFLKEPVDVWSTFRDEHDVTILEKFYANKKQYAFSFQILAYISRLALLKEAWEANNNAIIITERSLYTDRFVFAKMLHDSGDIELINYKIYLQWFDAFVNEYPVHYIIYVKADPIICNERIIKRSRTGESNISLGYLQSCNDYHQQMLEPVTADVAIFQKDTIMALDGNIDIYENPAILDIWIEDINKFIGVIIKTNI